jgi:hypothetical protein
VSGALLPTAAFGQACDGLVLSGDVIRVRLQIGTGLIVPTGTLVIDRLRFRVS